MATDERRNRTRLNGMVRDLQRMVKELADDTTEHEVLVKGVDLSRIGRIKTDLNTKLVELRKGLEQVQTGQAGESVEQIDLRRANRAKVFEIEALLGIYRKQAGTDEKHRWWLDKFQTELSQLSQRNTSVRTSTATNASNTSQRIAARQQRRRGRRGQKESVELDEIKIPVAASQTEMQFKQEMAEKDKQIDRYLDVISDGLVELRTMAIDIGTNLDEQKAILDKVDGKIDDNTDRLDHSSNRVVALLEENNCGVETWCPIIILIVMLLAIYGYLLTFAV